MFSVKLILVLAHLILDEHIAEDSHLMRLCNHFLVKFFLLAHEDTQVLVSFDEGLAFEDCELPVVSDNLCGLLIGTKVVLRVHALLGVLPIFLRSHRSFPLLRALLFLSIVEQCFVPHGCADLVLVNSYIIFFDVCSEREVMIIFVLLVLISLPCLDLLLV